MTREILTYALEGTTAIVQMDDGKANALSADMIEALLSALTRAEKEASAMVLAGRPDRFCAGFDLRVMMSGPEPAKALLKRGSDLLTRLYGSPIPVVVACTGHALAGGALVLLTGDIRVGASGAFRIGLNEVSIGLPVPVLAMELARDRLATTELARATLMAQIYAPEDAQKAGYLDVVVPAADVLARAREEAVRLGALARSAFSGTKARLRGKTIAHIHATLETDLSFDAPRLSGSQGSPARPTPCVARPVVPSRSMVATEPDFASAALRHARDAEHLLVCGEPASRDQAWHLAGFAHECARKACIQGGWVPRMLGHAFSDASEAVVDFAIALDPRAGRFPIRLWASRFPAVVGWNPEHRYERTGAVDVHARPVDAIVEHARTAVDACIVALYVDGSLATESIR